MNDKAVYRTAPATPGLLTKYSREKKIAELYRIELDRVLGAPYLVYSLMPFPYQVFWSARA